MFVHVINTPTPTTGHCLLPPACTHTHIKSLSIIPYILDQIMVCYSLPVQQEQRLVGHQLHYLLLLHLQWEMGLLAFSSIYCSTSELQQKLLLHLQGGVKERERGGGVTLADTLELYQRCRCPEGRLRRWRAPAASCRRAPLWPPTKTPYGVRSSLWRHFRFLTAPRMQASAHQTRLALARELTRLERERS
jgi:hypothetical protein